MSLPARGLHALVAPLLLLTATTIPASGSASASTDCLGATTYRFGTVDLFTHCVSPDIVVSADSDLEALGCAMTSAARRGVQVASLLPPRMYAICVTGFLGKSTYHVLSYSERDAEACARSQVCGALGDCTAAPNACR